jgi:hypothetical protein|tara:strand:- start:849 stop:2387 length:1539 start_codon:yes stop_codon:yes gene_type:complete
MISQDAKLLAVYDKLEKQIKALQLKHGVDGKDGADGISIKGDQGDRGHDGVGHDGKQGVRGADGADGTQGTDGVSITSATIDFDNHLVINLSDGTEIDAGVLQGGSGGDQYYRSGSTVNVNPNTPQALVYVREAADLAGVLDSTKLYFLDGQIDLGTQSIVVPSTGLNLAGHGFGISGLISTEANHTMFVTDGVTYSGDLFLTSMDIRCSGVGSEVFDLDNQENFNAIEWNTVNFLSCTSLGEVKSYRQGLGRNVAWISCDDGLTMSGNWSGFAMVDSIVVGAPMAGVLFRAGTALVISGSFRSNINILGLGTIGGSFCDFAPANITLDGGFAMSGVRADPDTIAFPNMPNTSVKARYRDCTGVRNTYVGASGTITTSTATVIATSGVYYSMAGAISVDEPTWLILFEDAGIEFNSDIATAFELAGAFSFSGTNNQVLSLKLYKYTAATTTWAAVSPSFEVTLNASNLAENVSFGAFVDMVKGDRLEFRVANLNGTNNITCLTGGQVRLKER